MATIYNEIASNYNAKCRDILQHLEKKSSYLTPEGRNEILVSRLQQLKDERPEGYEELTFSDNIALSLSFKIPEFYFTNKGISGQKKQRVSRQLFKLATKTKELELADCFIKIAHFFNKHDRICDR